MAQYSDLVTQMDGVFTKLNSNATAKVATSIFLDMEEMFDDLNNEKVKHQLSKNVIKMGNFLEMITGDKVQNIISNLEKATENSQIYVNTKDLEPVIILLEILIVLLIILTSIILTLFIMKLCKKHKEPEDHYVQDNIYHQFMPENQQQNIDM